MVPPRPTEIAQTILRDSIHEGDTVIDATAGNGHDTVFLAECVGASGRVLAFDVQETAIRSARSRVQKTDLADRVEFHQSSHARMADHAAADSAAAVMFNLGYLPGEDHEQTTETSETLTGLAVAAGLLKAGGILAVVCYPGHPAGASEAVAAEAWMTAQTTIGWRVAKYQMLGTLKPAPFLLVSRKA